MARETLPVIFKNRQRISERLEREGPYILLSCRTTLYFMDVIRMPSSGLFQEWRNKQEQIEITKLMDHGTDRACHTTNTKSALRTSSQTNTKRQDKETAGSGWFHMKSPVITPEIKNQVQVLQMRAFLDPKRFYKKDSSKNTIPKYFQLGTIQGDPLHYYSDRISRKQRNKDLLDNLLQDADKKRYLKRKFQEIQRTRNPGNTYRQLKKRRQKPWK